MMRLKYQVPDTVLYYKHGAVTVRNVRNDPFGALQGDFLTWDRSEQTRV